MKKKKKQDKSGPAVAADVSTVIMRNPFFVMVLYVTQARYRKEQASTEPAPQIPPVDNLLKDSTDGSALGALLHFYCPQLLSLDGKETGTVGGRIDQLEVYSSACWTSGHHNESAEGNIDFWPDKWS